MRIVCRSRASFPHFAIPGRADKPLDVMVSKPAKACQFAEQAATDARAVFKEVGAAKMEAGPAVSPTELVYKYLGDGCSQMRAVICRRHT